MRWRSFVAVGDSFTEGMDDAYPDGTYRGWADLVATRLAAEAGPDFGYANLAIRGRLFPNIVAEQVPAALAMKPDLISFAAGGNDVLRRTFDPASFVARFDDVVGELRSGGADVILFRFADVMARLPGQRLVAPRVTLLNRVVGRSRSGTAPSWSTCTPTTPTSTRCSGAPTGCTCRPPGTGGSPGRCSPRSGSAATRSG